MGWPLHVCRLNITNPVWRKIIDENRIEDGNGLVWVAGTDDLSQVSKGSPLSPCNSKINRVEPRLTHFSGRSPAR